MTVHHPNEMRKLAAGVRDVMVEHADDIDRYARFPVESLRALRATPLMGMLVPREHGGMGGDLDDMLTVADELASACLSSAFVWAMHCQQVDALVRFASAELAAHVLPRVAGGELYLASVTTEPGTGATLLQADAPLVGKGDAMTFRREAPIVTGVRHADGFLVTLREDEEARPDRVTLVYADRAEVDVQEVGEWDTLGMRGTESISSVISGAVPAWRVVGRPGRFREIAVESMMPLGHLGWSACWIGAARQALRAVAGVLRTTTSDVTGPGFDLTAERLARSRIELELASAYLAATAAECQLLRRTGTTLDLPAVQFHLNTLKVAASEFTSSAAERLLDLAGLDLGYRRGGLRLERTVRDLRAARLNYRNDRLLLTLGRQALLDLGVHLLGDDADRCGAGP